MKSRVTTPPPIPQAPATRTIEVPVALAPAVERMIANFQAGEPIAQPLGYVTPGIPAKRPWIDVPLLISFLMLAAVLTWLMVIVVPRYEDMFKDFGTRLPEPTQILLGISRFFERKLGWIIIWALALLIPVAVARLRAWPPRHPNRSLAISIFLAIFLISAICIVTYIILVLPMVTLIQAVSGGAGKP